MTSIKEEVEQILQDNNTAQMEFEVILEKIYIERSQYRLEGELQTNKKEIHVYEPLSGTIDLSILEKHGFSNIEVLHFHKPGRIVGIYHFPETLKQLYCNNQLIQEFADLPKSLELLDCANNYIQELDLENLTQLKILRCSDNILTNIDFIPISLEELICSSNQIKRLNLQYATSLKKLHCSNNRSIILEGVPQGIVDLQMDNDPILDKTKFCTNEGDITEEKTADDTEEKLEVSNALHIFFELKQKYTIAFLEKKKAIYKKEMDKKKAKRKIARMRPLCIKCRKPSGTLFEIKDRVYTAICGDKDAPCRLNIKIDVGYNENDIRLGVLTTEEELEKVKSAIIKCKMDSIMSYINESRSAQLFKQNMEKYNMYSKEYLEYIKKYENTMYGEIRRKCIEEKEARIYEIKQEIEEYIEKGGINEAVSLQIKELFPEIQNLQLLKYDVMEMLILSKMSGANRFSFQKEDDDKPVAVRNDAGETNDGDDSAKEPNEISYLYQQVVSINKMEFPYGVPAKVIHFVR